VSWPLVPLGEVADFINGVAFKPEDWEDSGRPIIRIQNLNDPRKPFNKTSRHVREGNLARAGDLLVSWSASLGVFEWQGEEACVNQHIFKVLPNYERVEHRYLYRALEQSVSEMESRVHGATMKHINRDEFLSVRVPLPPLPEQRRIAAMLDKADALRAKRRLAIAKLDQLLQSMFLEMFGDPVMNPKGWTRMAFTEILSAIESGSSPVCLDRPAAGDEWAVLKLGAVTKCVFDPSANKALPSDVRADPSLEVQSGDLLFTRKNTRDLVAACAYVSKTPQRLLLPDLIFRLRLKSDAEVSPRFMQALLTHPRKRRELQALAGGSAGSMPNISKAKLMHALVEVPPLSLQQRFSEIAEQIENAKRQAQIFESKQDTLFASLQQQSFAG
jgi:type I restriction enzyme, S subunit